MDDQVITGSEVWCTKGCLLTVRGCAAPGSVAAGASPGQVTMSTMYKRDVSAVKCARLLEDPEPIICTFHQGVPICRGVPGSLQLPAADCPHRNRPFAAPQNT